MVKQNINIPFGGVECVCCILPNVDFNPSGIHAKMMDAHVSMMDVRVSMMDVRVPKMDAHVPKMDVHVPKMDAHVPKMDAHVGAPLRGRPNQRSLIPINDH